MFDRRFPKREPRWEGRGLLRSASLGSSGRHKGLPFNATDGGQFPQIQPAPSAAAYPKEELFDEISDSRGESRDITKGRPAAARPDMGLAPGGRMAQEVFEDPYEFNDWDREHHGRCFVHLSNSIAWRAITQQDPPTTPFTAKDYTAKGYPWFEYYDDGKGLDGTKLTKELKSVVEMGFQKGFSIVADGNETVQFKSDQVVKLRDKSETEVRDGKWA